MPNLQQYVSLATFNAGDSYLNTIYSASPIDAVKQIDRSQYRVGGVLPFTMQWENA